MLVPIMVYLIGVPTRLAVGTSLVCLLLSSTSGALAYGVAGKIEYVPVIAMVLGACVGSPLGVKFSQYVHGARLRLLYAVMIILAALSVFLLQLDLVAASQGLILGAVGGMTALICLLAVKAMAAEKATELASQAD
jgi:uncharacterized membrane protein YfcA